MADKMKEWEQEAHNRGQEDGANGKYDNPYNSWYYVIFERGETNDALRQSYIEGFDNGLKNQPKEK